MKSLKYISFILLAFSLVTCKKEFLEIMPIGEQNSGTFYITQAAGEQAVISAYGQYNNVAFDKDLIMAADIISDHFEAGGEYVNEVPSAENFNRLTWLTTDGEIAKVYGTLYKSIYFANVAIERLPDIPGLDPEADPAVIERLIAECKFLRALDYSYLVRHFGGVPLVDHVLGSDEFFMARAELKAIYDLMEQDLIEAIAVLPEKSASPNVGRANKGAAKALMARNLLYESSYAKNYPGDERFAGMTERWDEALQYAEEVIESGQYSLVGINGERYYSWRSPNTNAYRYLFTSNGDNCSEAIFEIQCIADDKGWAAARGNSICQYSAARRLYDASGDPGDTDYWGLDLPSDGLVGEFETGDPRLRAGIAIEGNGDSIEIKGGERFLICFDQSVTRTYLTKYESSAAEFKDYEGPWHSAPQNIKLIRYADILLIAAEAAMELDQNGKALDYINQIRSRARLCGEVGNTVPADLTGTVTLEDIVHERAVELYGEGQRWYDLVRWNLATQYLNHYTEDGYEVIYEDPKHRFVPLPQDEMNVNSNLEQYPGWD